MRVLIVGAGLAGLTTAFRLLRARPPGLALDVTLLEAEARAGGKIRTERPDGFVVDAGADSFLSTRPWALELAEALGLSGELQNTRTWPQRAWIRRQGRFYPLPDGLSGLVPSSPLTWLNARMLHWPGRVRASLDLLLPAGARATDESVAHFARRRFGREAYDWCMEPLLAGIHGGDGEQLSLRATFPALAEAERAAGSVMRGLRRQRTQPGPDAEQPAKRFSAFVAPRAGMERLIEALLAQLDACTLRLGTRVDALDRSVAGWTARTDRDETIAADAVVVATPAHAAAVLLAAVSPALAAPLAGIPFASSTTVHVAYARSAVPHALEGAGYLNPRRSGQPVTACTWTSSKFEHRAPADAVLLRLVVKGEAAAQSEEELIHLTRAELRAALGITSAPQWHRVFRYIAAMPQYTLGHLDRVAAIEQALAAQPGLFLAGNSYHGVGIPDTVKSASHAADGVLAFARSDTPAARQVRAR
jgi:oxygen-dependent protoporphyrinogen oxidase